MKIQNSTQINPFPSTRAKGLIQSSSLKTIVTGLITAMIIIEFIIVTSGCRKDKDNEPPTLPPPQGEVYDKFALASRTDDNDNNYEIYVLESKNGTTKSFTKLTNNNIADHTPMWSPDGKKIAFARGSVMPDIHIWLMNADGSNQQQLVNDNKMSWVPTWSPDGKKIAYGGWDPSDPSNTDVYVINVDGTNDTRLTNDPTPEEPLSWSNNGLIAFTYGSYGSDGSTTGDSLFNSCEIYVMKEDGTDKRGLTNNNVSDYFPVFSPDGKKIAFGSNRDDNDNPYPGASYKSRICIMDTNGTNVSRLPMTYDTYCSWSPDGKRIAVVSGRSMLTHEIWVMNIDGSNPIGITPNIYWTEDVDWFPIQ